MNARLLGTAVALTVGLTLAPLPVEAVTVSSSVSARVDFDVSPVVPPIDAWNWQMEFGPDDLLSYQETIRIRSFDSSNSLLSDTTYTVPFMGPPDGGSIIGLAIQRGGSVALGSTTFYALVDAVNGSFDLSVLMANMVKFERNSSGQIVARQELYPVGAISAVEPVPIPAALPLFAAGLGAMGFMGWRKRRKAIT